MSDCNRAMGLEVEMAAPLHLQRLERSLNVRPLLGQVKDIFKERVSDEEEQSESSEESESDLNDLLLQREEQRKNKLRLFNLSNAGEERRWLQDILLSEGTDSSSGSSDSDSSVTEQDFKNMLKFHILRKKYQARFYQKPENIQYQYYSAGLLSRHDRFAEHQKLIMGNRKKKEKKPEKKYRKEKNINRRTNHNTSQEPGYPKEKHRVKKSKQLDPDDSGGELEVDLKQGKGRGRKRDNDKKSPEAMALKRRKIWMMMSKKELGKVQRAKTNNHKEMLISCKKVAQNCMKYWRQKAAVSQKNMKETIWRAKRLTREMQSYWKRCDRVERENRRRLEKEAEEQRKLDVELIEAKRQQRKLNFLITQTELYAHFMSRKLGKALPDDQIRILNQLNEEKNPRLMEIDDYDCEVMKQKAKKNAMEAFNQDKSKTQLFDSVASKLCLSDTPTTQMENPQPSIFKGILKGYQLKGMNWLADLYGQGINGILADEMGLGKTVQSIAFLCHIAEKYSVWGPFLVISPASTLHNWQQEMARFVPGFKVVPYWGSPQERKILRQFWDTKDLHTKEASFHVVITSYQLVITDYKYFNRIKWQYMILDEAQAIKSTNSMRWKLLLGFNCRNRLLLSGTPIQNSMAELWALLHFIMPTLFDSHDEFNEWFSKDIESHAENKTGIDEKHLSRLHMILKPFMLRRIKKDVENELSDKIEVMVYCPLTTRQKLLYSALKKRIRVEDLLHYSVGDSTSSLDKNFTSNLMNLVMQFRKVCNHPELFERRDARSPFFMHIEPYHMPVLLFKEGIVNTSLPSKSHLLYNKFFVFSADWVHHRWLTADSSFSFARFCNLSAQELNKFCLSNLLFMLSSLNELRRQENLNRHRNEWSDCHEIPSNVMWLLNEKLQSLSEPSLDDLVFTRNIIRGEPFYTHTDHVVHTMQETLAHSLLRCGSNNQHSYVSKPSITRECQQTTVPSFLCDRSLKVATGPRKLYVDHSTAVNTWRRHEDCEGYFGQRILWQGCDLRKSEPPHRLLRTQLSATFTYDPPGGLIASKPVTGWSNIVIPDKQTLVTDAGKLTVLDNLLTQLKEQGHRVLIYSQMTKMIDLLEEYMYHRKHTFMRLDGSSKISDRRDMVADFQKRADIFVFLLSTRAGGLGINLTAADTVIFYDSDWNPTVDQQAMDRAHRLGQTKQVTVYRLICKGTIEERILQRAREKSEIQRMVISGGNFKPDTLKPTEVVSLLLDDAEIEAKYMQRSEERKQHAEEARLLKASQAELGQQHHHKDRDRKRKQTALPVKNDAKRICLQANEVPEAEDDATPTHNQQLNSGADSFGTASSPKSEDSTSNDGLVVDVESLGPSPSSLNSSTPVPQRRPPSLSDLPRIPKISHHHHHQQRNINLNDFRMKQQASIRGASKRGRPRGSTKRGAPARGNFATPGNSQTSGANVSGEQVPSEEGSRPTQPMMTSPSGIRRGPGRPRLKPNGPQNQGYRVQPPQKTSPVPAAKPSGGDQQPRPFGFYTQSNSQSGSSSQGFNSM